MKAHWTIDDFIAALYAVGPPDSHIDDCAECRAKLAAFRRRAVELRDAAEPVVLDERLAAQRRAIYARVGAEKPSPLRKLAPVVAVAGMLAGGVFLLRPSVQHTPPGPAVAVMDNSAADAQFFDDIAAFEQSPEPQATQTIRGLFEE